MSLSFVAFSPFRALPFQISTLLDPHFTPWFPSKQDSHPAICPSPTLIPSIDIFWVGCFCFVFVVGCCWGECDIIICLTRNKSTIWIFYKSGNKGLISVDRRTSLLSHVQYPVPSESSTKDLSLSVPERRLSMVLGRSLSLRVNTKSGDIVAFQHGF